MGTCHWRRCPTSELFHHGSSKWVLVVKHKEYVSQHSTAPLWAGPRPYRLWLWRDAASWWSWQSSNFQPKGDPLSVVPGPHPHESGRVSAACSKWWHVAFLETHQHPECLMKPEASAQTKWMEMCCWDFAAQAWRKLCWLFYVSMPGLSFSALV